MAATTEGRALTEAHRLAQARLGARTVQLMLAAWPVLRIEDLDGTFPAWLELAATVIAAQRTASSTLAANYVATFRTLELGAGVTPATPVLAPAAPLEQIATSLLVTGPAVIRSNLARGTDLDTALRHGQARSAAAAMRHALNGGRDTVLGSVVGDDRALGWARATSGHACAFCAMLASRGPIYSEGTVTFRAHDHCSCSAEPVYRDDAAWPAGAEKYRDLWDEATGGLSGDQALSAFRHALAER